MGKAVLCPDCGYNAGENGERILEVHMKHTHKKTIVVPTEKEAAFAAVKGVWLCQFHPDAGKMSFLEFNRHKENSKSASLGGFLVGGVVGATMLAKSNCVPVQIEP